MLPLVRMSCDELRTVPARPSNICSNLAIKLNPSKDCEMHKFVDFLSEEFYKEAILKMEIIINGWQLKRLE